MKLDQIRKQKQTQGKATTSTKDKKIQYVSCTGDHSFLSELVDKFVKGRQKNKEGKSLYGTARRLYNHVTELLLANRSADRPKNFVFKGSVQDDGSRHLCTINVRTNGYGKIDMDAIERIKEITGDEFVQTYITESIVAKVDFALVPEDKKDKVVEVLTKLNSFIGAKPRVDADGDAVLDKETGEQLMQEFVEFDFGYKPNSMFHSARATELTQEQDEELNSIVPIIMAFGK